MAVLTGDNGTIGKAGEAKFKTELSAVAEEYELYLTERLSNDRSFEEGALYAGKNALIYNSVQEEGNIYTVLKNSNKKYVDNFEIIKGELFYFSENEQQEKWAKEIGIKVSPYIIIDGVLMSSDRNLELMDEATGTITIPQNVTKIGEGAFRDVAGLRSIVIPGTVKEIGNNAFSGNPTLQNVVIEEGVERIGAYAFQQCSALKTMKIADSVIGIGSDCFAQCTALTEINFPKGLTTIPYEMLMGCNSLTELLIPEGIQKIDSFAFRNCYKVKKITIPSTVNNIIGNAFTAMSSLNNIDISEENKTYSFQDNVLMSKDRKTLHYVLTNSKTINIPPTVEVIESGALSSFIYNVELIISENVKKINSGFSENIVKITVTDANEYYKTVDGNLYSKDMTTLYRYTQNQSSFDMPNTVKHIAGNAFQSRYNLTQLNLSENLESIMSWVFSGTRITQLYLPSKVNGINTQAFGGVNIAVTIAEDNPNYKTEDGALILTKDGKATVATSNTLETYNIPSSVETIGSGTFYYRGGNFKEIVMPNNVKNIEESAFFRALSLSKIEIPSTIQNIGAGAFNECNNLREIIIDKKEGSISGAPWGCPYGLRAVFWKR